ncbi:MAG: O-antigen ligase family protein [Dehalococcoidia bacterium]
MTIQIEKALLLAVKVGILLVLFAPLVVAQGSIFPYVVGKAIYIRGLIEVVFACWLILAMRSPQYRTPRSWVLWLFGMYLFVNLVAALAGVSFQRSFWGDYRRMGGVFDLTHWFAFAVVLVSVLRDARQWRWLLNANLGVSLFIAFLGLAQHYDIRVLDRFFWYLQPTGRVDITFGNPSYVAAYMLVNVFVALAFLTYSYQRLPLPSQSQTRARRRRSRLQSDSFQPGVVPWRAFWAIAAFVDLWALMLSGTRGAVIGLAVGLLVVGLGYVVWGNRRRVRLLIGVLIVTLLLAIPVLSLAQDTALFRKATQWNVMTQRFQRVITRGTDDPSIKLRLSAARAGLEAFGHRPVLGWGPENFVVAFDRYAVAEDFTAGTRLADQAHNKPIEELVTKGLMGFTAYALLLGWMGWILVRTVRENPEDRLFALFVGGALIAYLVQNLFLFDTPGTFLQLVLLLGWVAGREVFAGDESRPRSFRSPPGGASGATGSKDSPGYGRKTTEQTGFGAVLTWFSVWFQGTGINPTILIRTVTALIVVLMVAGLYFLNYLPYRAANVFPVKSASLDLFMTDAQRSFETFPPLATLPRQILFDTLNEHWDQVSTTGKNSLLPMLLVEGEKLIESEPENARLYLSVARLFQRAGPSAPEYLPVARRYVETAQELAPGILGTIDATMGQEVAEGSYAKALTMIYDYRGSDPIKAGNLSAIMNEAQNKLIGEIGIDEYMCRWAGKDDLTLEERALIECKEKSTS